MCQLTLPYLGEGSCIVNIASVAAFQPIPYINVYAASKAFVLQLSRALNREVRPQGIRVMALCPFWTKTEFFDQAIDAGREQIVKKYTAMYDPAQIVRRAWRDLARGKDVSKYGFVARFQAALLDAPAKIAVTGSKNSAAAQAAAEFFKKTRRFDTPAVRPRRGGRQC